MPGLSVVIITKNEERNILQCLESVKGIAEEIIVVDSLSTDRTAIICESFGCRFITHEFEGFGKQKQFGVNLARNDWVLSIDADEVVSDELSEEIKEMFSSEISAFNGFYIPFSFFYLGRILRYSGMKNEKHLRLFNRQKGGFTEAIIHEGINLDGPVGRLKGKIIHYSYRNIGHHLDKINIYTTNAAVSYYRAGRTFSTCWMAVKFPVTFFTFYFIRGGFRDGYPGFIWSFLGAFYASLKIAKTIEMNKQ